MQNCNGDVHSVNSGHTIEMDALRITPTTKTLFKGVLPLLTPVVTTLSIPRLSTIIVQQLMDVQRPFCANFVRHFSLTFLITYIFELSFPTKSPKIKVQQLSFFRLEVTAFFFEKLRNPVIIEKKPVNLTFFKECCSYVFHPLTAFIVFP